MLLAVCYLCDHAPCQIGANAQVISSNLLNRESVSPQVYLEEGARILGSSVGRSQGRIHLGRNARIVDSHLQSFSELDLEDQSEIQNSDLYPFRLKLILKPGATLKNVPTTYILLDSQSTLGNILSFWGFTNFTIEIGPEARIDAENEVVCRDGKIAPFRNNWREDFKSIDDLRMFCR